MGIRLSANKLKSAVAIASVIAGTGALAGCTSLGSRAFGDPVTTGSTTASPSSNLGQPMPSSLGAPTQTAMNEFLPPENVGGLGTQPMLGSTQPMPNQSVAPLPPLGGASPTVSTATLPPLGSTQPSGTPSVMPAQSNVAPVTVAAPITQPPRSQTLTPANTNGSGGTHVIQNGESLYSIARTYNVTTQALVQANNLASPDRIVVGQTIIIPGRPGSTPQPVAQSQSQQVADVSPQPSPVTPATPPAQNTAQGTQPLGTTQPSAPTTATTPAPSGQVASQTQPTQQPAAPLPEPETSADNFRWPVSGRVITDFASSRGTGINIEVPEGTTVRAAENGTVIYVGSGVEGYGNLILIRHSNGYVSAYAHLKDMSVQKGATVSRGDSIGTSGMSGSVSRPQLHFELRRGATPVDPIPLLAG